MSAMWEKDLNIQEKEVLEQSLCKNDGIKCDTKIFELIETQGMQR
jgi:hypothetical protein